MNFINNLALTAGQKRYLKDLVEKIKSVMHASLYQHSVNTLEYAVIIAKKHLTDIDFFNLSVACILHDYGKRFNYGELVEVAKENKLKLSSFEFPAFNT